MRTIKYTAIAAAIVMSLSSCTDFLSEKPSKTSALVPSEATQLDAMLNSYSTFWQESNMAKYYSTDAFGLLTAMTDEKVTSPGISPVFFACWDVNRIANNETRYNIQNYSGEYKKIFTANMVQSNLDKVSGDQALKDKLKAECALIKAYSMFELAQTYCLPYTDDTSNADELGMTLKNSTSFEENAKRATLKETYDYIETNLEEALKLTNKMEYVNNKYLSIRGSKAAANGLAARYWLTRGDYTKARDYAAAALADHSVLMDYNVDMRFSDTPVYATHPDGYQILIDYPYTGINQSDYNDRFEWKEFIYFRTAYNAYWYFIPSEQLLNLYDKDYDLRYKYHIVKHYSWYQNRSKLDWPGYVFFFKDNIPCGITTAEMLLVKAEAQARLDDVNGAMATVNTLRAARMDKKAPASAINLTASTKEEAVKKIIDEREREMPFSMRWYDLRRLNHNKDSWDDVGTITRTYYKYNGSTVLPNDGIETYTLKPGDRKYAMPIPNAELIAGAGAIEQNKY